MIFAGGGLQGSLSAAAAEMQVRGEAGSGQLGENPSVGDFDGDGWPDVFVDSPPWGATRGRTYWFPGGTLL